LSDRPNSGRLSPGILAVVVESLQTDLVRQSWDGSPGNSGHVIAGYPQNAAESFLTIVLEAVFDRLGLGKAKLETRNSIPMNRSVRQQGRAFDEMRD
jgi:hypothetical protein